MIFVVKCQNTLEPIAFKTHDSAVLYVQTKWPTAYDACDGTGSTYMIPQSDGDVQIDIEELASEI